MFKLLAFIVSVTLGFRMGSILQQIKGVASSFVLRKKSRILTPPDKPGLVYGIAQLVNDLESLEDFLAVVSNSNQLAIDAEGINLGRTGKLCLLSVSPAPPPDAPVDTPATVFLLDVTTLSARAFTHTPRLGTITAAAANSRTSAAAAAVSGAVQPTFPRSFKDVLECSSVTKLFYDVRCDSEALYHQHGVALQGVVDLQLAEVAYRRYGPAVRRVGFVIGLTRALESYLQPLLRERWKATAVDKRELHRVFDEDPQYWDRRPLTQEQVRYASDDVLYLHHLHRELSGSLSQPVLERVARFSQYRVTESQQLTTPERKPGGDPTRAIAPAGL